MKTKNTMETMVMQNLAGGGGGVETLHYGLGENGLSKMKEPDFEP